MVISEERNNWWFPVQNMHYILSSPLYLVFCNLGDIQLSWVSRVNMLLSAEAQEYILSEKWAVESGVGVDQLWLWKAQDHGRQQSKHKFS